MFAILQKYDFSSKSQLQLDKAQFYNSCLRYCKSTIFQANHNGNLENYINNEVVCDTAKVRFFKQITTDEQLQQATVVLFAILQKYDFSSKSQLFKYLKAVMASCLRYCKSTIFQANHNSYACIVRTLLLFAILQKYDFSSKSQPKLNLQKKLTVVCDTAKVRFFKQITTLTWVTIPIRALFAILQKYDFSSKSQRVLSRCFSACRCLRYCKSTIFQANHNFVE